jgi:hypothetical protein
MGDPHPHPLSDEEAKERLRRAAEKAGLASLIRRHPYQALLIAGLAGQCWAAKRSGMTSSSRPCCAPGLKATGSGLEISRGLVPAEALDLGDHLGAEQQDQGSDLQGEQDHHGGGEGPVDHIDQGKGGEIPDQGMAHRLPEYRRDQTAEQGVAKGDTPYGQHQIKGREYHHQA